MGSRNLLGVAGTPAFSAELHQASSNKIGISGCSRHVVIGGYCIFFVTGKLPFWGADSLELANSTMFDDKIPEVETPKREILYGPKRNLDKRLTIKLAAR